MERYLDVELTNVKEKLLKMAGLAELAIDKSIRSLKERDAQLAAQVVEEDEAINALEIQVENDCFTLLARQQPVAADLRVFQQNLPYPPLRPL